MGEGLLLLVLVLGLALVFDFINGFHDAANAIATVVSTGVLPIRTAVLLAGVLNFAGAIAGTAVAKTIASGFADPGDVTQAVVLAALIGASTWNLITWWYGIPSSSSHALIGALAGAVAVHAGLGRFNWKTLVEKVLVPLVVSPLFGFVLAFVVMLTMLWIIRALKPKPQHVQRGSRVMQLLSASAMAFAHGSNDAQKSMGIMTLALTSFITLGGGAALPAWMAPHGKDVPTWVVLACAAAIGLGTMAGGERIIKTMGTKIIKITPLQGFAAETSGASTILLGSQLGIPLSTTHCINACIMGVGAVKRLSAVRWGVAGSIVMAWVLTIPAAAAIAGISMVLLDVVF
ncbi:MAG: inorganic phosphate transporter [Polyangiaceae bacterium]|nr:inorganic phosphate transporter [Polyangiaceae bacterium]